MELWKETLKREEKVPLCLEFRAIWRMRWRAERGGCPGIIHLLHQRLCCWPRDFPSVCSHNWGSHTSSLKTHRKHNLSSRKKRALKGIIKELKMLGEVLGRRWSIRVPHAKGEWELKTGDRSWQFQGYQWPVRERWTKPSEMKLDYRSKGWGRTEGSKRGGAGRVPSKEIWQFRDDKSLRG